MLPRDLQAASFAAYPPGSRQLAVAHLALLQALPISFLPSLLRELIQYDYKFPAERDDIDSELAYLSGLSATQLSATFRDFARLNIPSKLGDADWVNHPAQFVEQESAALWSTHQLDAFRVAATQYGESLRAAAPAALLPLPRLGIAVIGQGTDVAAEPLFRNLRKHGTYFTSVNPDHGLDAILAAVEARAQAHPAPYAHWYIEGAVPPRATPSLTTVCYQTLEPVRSKLLKFMQTQIARPGMGPEELRTDLARLAPPDLGMSKDGDPVLDRFQVSLFTEGSGTQIFSTTFAQWTARESLRRAQPLTLLVRYAPRQRQRPMNELLSGTDTHAELDPAGSLVDADMGAYYHWINQQRLPGADRSSFLVWFEGHQQALVISPSLPRGVQSNSALDLKALLALTSNT